MWKTALVLAAALGASAARAMDFAPYGTWVGMEYVRAHPERLSRLVLDSPLDPGGLFA